MSYNKQKKNRDEEKVFSVTMIEEELSLFSEFLEQREFERKDDPEWIWDDTLPGKSLQIRPHGYRWGEEEYDEYGNHKNRDTWGEIYKNMDSYNKSGSQYNHSTPETEFFHNRYSPKEERVSSNNWQDTKMLLEDELESKRSLYRRFKDKYKDDPKGKEYLEKLKTEIYDYDHQDDLYKKRAGEIGDSLRTINDYRKKSLNEVFEQDPKPKPKTHREIIKDVPIITEPEEEDKDTLALAHQVRFNEEQKKKLSGVKPSGRTYNPKTDQPLEEIKDAPIITEPEEKERTKELNKFRRDRKREEFVNRVKEIPGKAKNKFDSLSESYEDISGGRSLGKDAAIIAGTTAALGAGAYGIHRYLKNKKKNKDEAEKKYKTSDKKKK